MRVRTARSSGALSGPPGRIRPPRPPPPRGSFALRSRAFTAPLKLAMLEELSVSQSGWLGGSHRPACMLRTSMQSQTKVHTFQGWHRGCQADVESLRHGR